MAYIEENLGYVEKRVKEDMPGVKLFQPEGTYFLWLSFAKSGFKGRELEKLLINKAKLALDPGRWFGEQYSSYARLNIGCSRRLPEEALNRLSTIVQNGFK